MIRTRDTFSQALSALRSLARTGEFAPGRPVIIQDEARRLRLSTTPVREALCWMCGEGLLERAPTGGFVAPRLDASTLAQRYRFRLLCLEDALSRGGEWMTPAEPAPTADAAVVFRHLVESVGDSVLLAAFDRVQALLDVLIQVEASVLTNHDVETQVLLRAVRSAAQTEALRAFHRRRIEAAPRLALAACQGSGRQGP